MELEIHIVHLFLGVLQFFLINWIGKHSYSIGYISISVFAKVEEAPAFNFLIRVLTPIVFIIISASIFYSLSLDEYVVHFYTVNIYYIVFRLAFNIVTDRGILLNWYRQSLYWISIIVISYFTYEKIIRVKKNLYPDFDTIANELWIIILIFLFHVTNNVRFSSDATVKRKNRYVRRKIEQFELKYADPINSISNDKLKALVYSILIIENFNRPRVARWIEYLRFFVTKKPHTLGVMQVFSEKYIDDRKSVELGIKKILERFQFKIEQYRTNKEDYYGEESLVHDLAGSYNTGSEYSSDVMEMWNRVLELKYPQASEALYDGPTPDVNSLY